MKLIICQILLLCCCFTFLKAQTEVSGLVQDRNTRKVMEYVDVFNLSNKTQATTNARGEFKIKAALNDVLIFNLAGYKTDTLLLTNLNPLRRYLDKSDNLLNAVTVINKQNLKEQYAQTFNKANAVLLTPGRGLLFYPSSYFSREGKQARKFKRMLKSEVKESQIDKWFNPKNIKAILPLQQPELDAFMVMYRPNLKFVQKAEAEDLKFYLIDAYNKFKLLPAEKRVLPSLKVEID
jgi:hypothetical protein